MAQIQQTPQAGRTAPKNGNLYRNYFVPLNLHQVPRHSYTVRHSDQAVITRYQSGKIGSSWALSTSMAINSDTPSARTGPVPVYQFGIPLYLADFTGELKVFMPGDETLSPHEALQLLSVKEHGFATGRVVKDADNRVIRVNTQSPGW